MGACGDRAWKDHRKNKYSGKCSNKGVLEIPRGESVKGEEGLEQILHLRGRRMRTKKEGRERAEEKTKGTGNQTAEVSGEETVIQTWRCSFPSCHKIGLSLCFGSLARR